MAHVAHQRQARSENIGRETDLTRFSRLRTCTSPLVSLATDSLEKLSDCFRSILFYILADIIQETTKTNTLHGPLFNK